MATFKINDMISSLENKSQELLDKIEEMEKNVNLSENTVRTQKQQKSHEVHNLLIMAHLCRFLRTYYYGDDNGEMEMPGDLSKWFESTVTLSKDRDAARMVTFKDGDDITDIMRAHPKKTFAQLLKLMEDQGYHLEGSTVRK